MCNLLKDPSDDPLSDISLPLMRLRGISDLFSNKDNGYISITPEGSEGISRILLDIADEIQRYQEQVIADSRGK